MALSLFPVFQYEESFLQFLADINTERTGTITLTTKKHQEWAEGFIFETL
jgi:hypothetical protein